MKVQSAIWRKETKTYLQRIKFNMSCLKRDSRVIVNRNNRNERARRTFSKKITEDSSSFQVFLDYARLLIQETKFKETFSVLALYSRHSSLPMEVVREVGDSLIKHYSSRKQQGQQHTFSSDPWSCCICATVLVEPVTLPCGHTTCRKCLLKDISGICRKCGAKYQPIDSDPMDDECNVKVSILVSALVVKYWTPELQAVEHRSEGNRQFQRSEVAQSISSYTAALEKSPRDHLASSNRSHAFFRDNRLQEALEDAERTIGMKPDWGKGYFRKGMALAAMDRPHEALISFFQCLVFEENCSKALRGEIYKVIFKLISKRGSSSDDDNVMFQRGLKESIKRTSMSAPDISNDSAAYIKGSTGTASETEDSESDEEDSSESGESPISLMKFNENKKMLVSRNNQLCHTLDLLEKTIKDMLSQDHQQMNREIDPSAVDISDFDCSLCFRLIYQPITTSCGHTYCKSCIDRCLDHKRECPLCKTVIESQNSVKAGVNEFIEETMKRMLPSEFAERKKGFEDEMTEIIGTSPEGSHTIPIFICTMSFPSVPCPLHVFEPRYRLMIRRTMEAGTREFGMCTNAPDKPFSDYGTMLEIRDIQYFSDGRSVVDTMGSRRFKVISRGVKDGYNTAQVEFLKDLTPTGEALTDLQSTHDRTHALATNWFRSHSEQIKAGILSHYGDMPRVEQDYWSMSSGPSWAWWVLAILPLDNQAQQQILGQTQLKKRLEATERILGFIIRRHRTRDEDQAQQ